MTNETEHLSKADQQVVADEAAATVAYEKVLVKEDASLPHQTQELTKAQRSEA